MRTIVFAGSKGGTGKTSLTAGLAVFLADNHRVTVADLDPQKSLTRFLDRRLRVEPDECRPQLIPGMDAAGAHADARKRKADFLVVDAPPGSIAGSARAIAVADFVIVPV